MTIVMPGNFSDWVAAAKEVATELGPAGIKVIARRTPVRAVFDRHPGRHVRRRDRRLRRHGRPVHRLQQRAQQLIRGSGEHADGQQLRALQGPDSRPGTRHARRRHRPVGPADRRRSRSRRSCTTRCRSSCCTTAAAGACSVTSTSPAGRPRRTRTRCRPTTTTPCSWWRTHLKSVCVGLAMRYVLRKVALFVVTLWAAITLNFVLPRLMPGSPVDAALAKLASTGQPVTNAQRHAIEVQLGVPHANVFSQYGAVLEEHLHAQLRPVVLVPDRDRRPHDRQGAAVDAAPGRHARRSSRSSSARCSASTPAGGGARRPTRR